MKRSEISEGAEVYYSQTNTYLENSYGTQGKATVIMVAAIKAGAGWERPARYRPAVPGDRSYSKAQVLIILDRGEAYQPEQMLVPLSQLRGPYADTLAEVERSRAAIAAYEQEATSRGVARQRQTEALVAGLKLAIGVEEWDAVRVSGNYTSDPQVVLTRKGAQALLDLLADRDAKIGALTDDLTRERLALRKANQTAFRTPAERQAGNWQDDRINEV